MTADEPMEALAKLRSELAGIDDAILQLVARRQSVAKEIGRRKVAMGRSTRDFGQEKQVAARARASAAALGFEPALAEDLVLLLIQGSLTAQEQERVMSAGDGNGRKVLIIGGAGKMGRWFARFLSSQGFEVEIADPAGPVDSYPHISDWRSSALEHGIIVVAAPLRETAVVLEELSRRKPSGIVFDIGSLKSPLRAGLRQLRSAGVAATSIHPMFGPDTELLSGRHVIFLDVGDARATAAARELFASTMVTQVEMDLDSHDRLIAFILGLSHAINIVFLNALSSSGENAGRFLELSSTTFDAQLGVARRVARENPHLYFEIQSLNEHGGDALERMVAAAEKLRAAISTNDEAAFVAMMRAGGEYFGDCASNGRQSA